MRQKILDKIIVIIMIVTAMVLFSGTVTAFHVASALLAVIMLTMDDILNYRYTGIVIGLVALVAGFINPVFAFAIVASVYCLVYRREVMNYIAVAVLMVVALVTGEGVGVRVFIVVASIVAGYIAYTTSKNMEAIKTSTNRFDAAREEAYQNVRQRLEMRARADTEVYTATLKERNRIAREIHDNVGHMITRVIVQMQAIKIINKDPVVGAQLDSVSETLDIAMTGIRKSVHELHDDSIDLAIGINDIARTLPERFDTNVSTSIESPADNDTKTCILGIVKEAVTNIAKHSNGDKVKIEVVENNTFWRVSIIDNGKCDPKDYSTVVGGTSDGHGIGIENIFDRAGSLGGRATINSDSNGFSVLATIPKKEQ